MSDRKLSLIDVQVGMYKLSLQTRLTAPCFQFFWGLIMKANTLTPRFKNPFDLTVEQAMGIGGGKSRQTIWDKQQRLKKIKIDGYWLIKIRAGNRLNNEAASYKINYDLIVPETLMIPEFTAQPSNISDDLLTNPLTINGRSADHPKIRSEEEKKTTTEAAVARPSVLEEEPIPNIRSDQVVIEGAILAKYRSQIMEIPPSQTGLRDALELYSVDQLQEAIQRMPDILRDGIQDGNGVLGLACKAVRNPHWWTNGELQGEGRDEKQRLRDELQTDINSLERLEGQREMDGHKPGYEEIVADTKQRIKELEAQINESV